MQGKAHLLVFVAADIALRVFSDETSMHLREADGAKLLNYAKVFFSVFFYFD